MSKSISATTKAVLLVAIVVYPAVLSAWADRGHIGIVVRGKPSVSVYNRGQKAIIGWNGEEEVLILSTDLSAGGTAKVLEFLPLPSKPTQVELADFASFSEVEKIIAKRAYIEVSPKRGRAKTMGGGARENLPPPVKIVFHEQIGPHDITIAEVNELNGFLSWARDFAKKNGGDLPAKADSGMKKVVESYLNRGYRYFVFDVIELSKELKTVPPVFYRFKSDHLFFPLLVSSLDKGKCEIDLFLFSPPLRPGIARGASADPAMVKETRTGFEMGYYRRYWRNIKPIQFLLRRSSIVPISSYQHRTPGQDLTNIYNDEIAKVSTHLSDLFVGWDRVQFTAAHFNGKTNELQRDFIVRHSEKLAGQEERFQLLFAKREREWKALIADIKAQKSASNWRQTLGEFCNSLIPARYHEPVIAAFPLQQQNRLVRGLAEYELSQNSATANTMPDWFWARGAYKVGVRFLHDDANDGSISAKYKITIHNPRRGEQKMSMVVYP